MPAKTPATALLDAHKVAYRLHSYRHRDGEAFGQEAAAVLGLDPARVFKTLVAEVDGSLTVGVLPVTGTLDLKALSSAVGGKRARMAQVRDAERATGYVAGGISPLGQKRRLPVVLDQSARGFDTMFCSGGRRGLELELAPDDLVRLTGATVAAISARSGPAV
ncbi:MAG: Cys-tRNA(Pro) deacylase [Pseudonocardia sp.]|nr:Cys-tRNA(Pro) deacylase [Pseudonocardia sp.]MBO0875933.1 Cys-tRNA(Pro) deacylase [Pseudonocardia sp.]